MLLRTRIGPALAVLPVLALVVTASAVPAAASAAPDRPYSVVPSGAGHGLPRPQVLPISITAAGFHIPGPDPRPAGPVTFKVSTDDLNGYYWGIGQLHGLTNEQAQALEQEAYSPDLSVALPALRALYAGVEYFGGAGQFGGQPPISVTLPLAPGPYNATATSAVMNPSPDTVPLADSVTVSHRREAVDPPKFDAVIRMVERNGATYYELPRRMPGHGTYLFVNDTSQPQEAVFGGVLPGTTDADVQAYFDTLAAGQYPPGTFVSRVGGLMAMSPGHWAELTVDWAPGRYSVQSFYRDPNTGVGRVYEGMHKIVDIY